MNWSTLPSEILFSSFIDLDLLSLVGCSLVCKGWRFNVLDDHLWKNLFQVHFSLDSTVPYENQSYRMIYKRKYQIFRAIRNGNVYIKNIIANHELSMDNQFIGPGISMYKDNVIATCGVQTAGQYLKVLGCHAKNIYTEEVSKQLGRSWYSKVIGDYLLSFTVRSTLGIEWNSLKATKIPSDISEIKFDGNKSTWNDREFKHAVFNTDPSITEVIAVDQRTGDSVLYDWLKLEKTDISGQIQGTPIAYHKNTIVTKNRNILYVYQDYTIVHQSSDDHEIAYVALNDNLLVCATESFIRIFNRRDDYSAFKLKRQQSYPLFLFDDLLVHRQGQGLAFYNVSSHTTLGTVFYTGSYAQNIIRHSPNEFVVQTNDAVMLLKFEIKSNPISVMHFTETGELKEITIESADLLGTAQTALKSTFVDSCYVMKKPQANKRFIMLFNGKPDKKAKPNVQANLLLREYFRVTDSYVYMPFSPYTTQVAKVSSELHRTARLDRDVVVAGSVIIYCECVVNGKTELVKPDKWPVELYVKTIGEVNKSDGKNKNKKKKFDRIL